MRRNIHRILNTILLLGVSAAIALVVHGWSQLPDAAAWGRILIGTGVGVAAAIGVMFRLPLELRANLTLTGIASLLTLWAASCFLYEPERSPAEVRHGRYQAAARKAGVPFDARTPRQVIEDLRRNGVDAYPHLAPMDVLANDSSPALLEPDSLPIVPLAGRSRTTTVECNENGQHLIVESDRYGFNNPDRAYATPASILLLGDSFAYGYCVRPGRDIASLLRARGLELVNLGYPGTGPLIQLGHLREYGPIVRPSVVLWVYFHGNDLMNLAGEYQQPALRRYLVSEYRQDLPARQAEIDTFWASVVDWEALQSNAAPPFPLMEIVLLQPLRERLIGRRESSIDPARSVANTTFDPFDAAVEQMAAEADRLGAQLYFVFLPAYGEFIGKSMGNRDEVLASLRTRGVPIIDFEKRLRETGDPLQYYPFREHAHFDEAGYTLLAEQILEVLSLEDDLPVTRPRASESQATPRREGAS